MFILQKKKKNTVCVLLFNYIQSHSQTGIEHMRGNTNSLSKLLQ